ncbi:hypothetical protein C0J52_02916 [Blattella germanica]|nr:hypothetical protein C0J52_02916 [Blattella germanica]
MKFYLIRQKNLIMWPANQFTLTTVALFQKKVGHAWSNPILILWFTSPLTLMNRIRYRVFIIYIRKYKYAFTIFKGSEEFHVHILCMNVGHNSNKLPCKKFIPLGVIIIHNDKGFYV